MHIPKPNLTKFKIISLVLLEIFCTEQTLKSEKKKHLTRQKKNLWPNIKTVYYTYMYINKFYNCVLNSQIAGITYM